ncbi:MAG: hypothetical protein ACI8QC_004254 [Planctomycetota bacterium]|jgi:hypothetical protein
MSSLNALLTREAREQMNLVLVAFLAVPALVIGLQLEFLGDSPYSHEWVGLWIIPGVVLTMLLALVMDSTTRESGSDMGESLGRLPVSRRSLLAAKFIWLGAVAVMLLACAYLAEALCAFGRGGMPAPVDFHLAKAEHMPVYLCMGLSLLLMAALGLWIGRTFVTGAVFLAIVGGAVALIRANQGLILALPEVLPREVVFTAIPLSLLLAGALAYRPGYALPGENLRKTALFLGVFGCASGGVVLGHWQGHEAAMIPNPGEGRPSLLGLTPDGRMLTLICGSSYEALIGGRRAGIEVLVLDTQTWKQRVDGVREVRATAKEELMHGVKRTGTRYRYHVSTEGVLTRWLGDGGRTELCRLPVLDGAEFRWVSPDPRGEYLFARAHTLNGGRRGVYLQADTGEVVLSLPEGWRHGQWGNRRDWIATAWSWNMGGSDPKPYQLAFVGRTEHRFVQLPSWGSSVPLLDGTLAYIAHDQVVLLDPDGKQLRVIYEPRPSGESP